MSERTLYTLFLFDWASNELRISRDISQNLEGVTQKSTHLGRNLDGCSYYQKEIRTPTYTNNPGVLITTHSFAMRCSD
jgi:hypothetical protein